MNQNTSNDTSVKVINSAREDELLSLLRTLHGKVLTCLTEVGAKPTFPEDFSKCGNEDYKNIHQASRALISGARKARWEKEVAGIRTGLKSVIDTYMVAQRAEKADYDAIPAQHRKFLAPFPTSFSIPFSALTSAFPQGTTPEQMVARCKELSHTVVKGENGYALKVAFVPATTNTDKVEEKAPESGNVTKAA